MPRTTAVIFDLDGTLIDSVADIAAACNQALAEFGLPEHGLDAYRYFIGEGVEKLVALAMAPQPFDAAVLAAHKRNYEQQLIGQTQPFPGIVVALQQLAQAGLPMAVLSNKPHAPTQQLVQHFFGDVPFQVVAGARPEFPRKPEPAAALHICAQLGVLPQDCAFVGDTVVDVATARNAGMCAIGVAWGSRPEEAAQADVVVTDVAALVAVLLGLSDP